MPKYPPDFITWNKNYTKMCHWTLNTSHWRFLCVCTDQRHTEKAKTWQIRWQHLRSKNLATEFWKVVFVFFHFSPTACFSAREALFAFGVVPFTKVCIFLTVWWHFASQCHILLLVRPAYEKFSQHAMPRFELGPVLQVLTRPIHVAPVLHPAQLSHTNLSYLALFYYVETLMPCYASVKVSNVQGWWGGKARCPKSIKLDKCSDPVDYSIYF